MARIINGTRIAQDIQAEIAAEVEDFKTSTGVTPCLGVVMAGNDPASLVYVTRKREACARVGMTSQFYCPTVHHMKPSGEPGPLATDAQQRVEAIVAMMNDGPSVHGILVQLPLPVGLDEYSIFDLIAPHKDVDVFNPQNVGLLVQGRPRLKPCTPHGIQEMLRRSGIGIAGKKVVVINRSNVVGKPLSSMLIQDNDEYANATVTVCHNRTPSPLLREIVLGADIVVVAVGIPGFLTADMVRPGQVVIDVGVNRLEGKKLVGDVDFPAVSKIVEAISPVPGGVGPMTVTMLLRNTLDAAKEQQ
jgi:methylenetetrahydrofolate dehydrogenase (NADP+)/methenyltetrahydrofolate cyclohydrolase